MATAQDGEELLIAFDVSNEAIATDKRGRDATDEVQGTSKRSRVVWLASFFTSMIIDGMHYSGRIFQDQVVKSGLKPSNFMPAGCSEIACSSFFAQFWTRTSRGLGPRKVALVGLAIFLVG